MEATDIHSEPQIPKKEEGPSLLKKLRERANQQMQAKLEEAQRLKVEEPKAKKKFLKNKFRFKKQSQEAERLRSLSRKEKKKLLNEKKRLQGMSEREVAAYQMLNDPNNQFMRKITLEGEAGLKDLQRNEIWQSIFAKKQRYQNLNEFLNSLTDDEFTEFIQSRDIPDEKLLETDRQKEFYRPNIREFKLETHEQQLTNKAMQSVQLNEQSEIKLEDISKEFKVFRDPTFKEFLDIFGSQYIEELPLFAQLYYLKEVLQFYQLNQNKTFLSLSIMNISLNVAYFFINRKLLYRNVKFFSWIRILSFFVFSQFLHEQIVIKNYSMNNYRVNLNDLFDQDEDFLFKNEYFRALIRKTQQNFEYLVNPVFDLEEIFKNANKEVDEKLQKPQGGYYQMNQGELIYQYAQTFNSPRRSRLVYDQMIKKYDEFFNEEKKNAENRLNQLVMGKNIHQLIKQMLNFYDNKENPKNKELFKIMEVDQEFINIKNQINLFVDSLIETLNNEFNEKTVTVRSPRRDKIKFLKQLSMELDSDYADDEQFFKMIEKNQEELLSVHLSEKSMFVPKSDLKFNEYEAIKNFYSGADFERNSFLTMVLPFVSTALWIMQRFGRKFKWL